MSSSKPPHRSHAGERRPSARDAESQVRLDELTGLFRNGRIGRRGFMQGALALGVSLSSATAFVQRVEAAQPKRGGDYSQGLTGGATSDVLDPALTLDSYMIQVNFGMLRNNLTEIAPNGDLIPELAESWEPAGDASKWVFTLRKGVEFHDGKTLEARDVVETMRHHMGEGSKSAAKGLVDQIEDVRADGKDKVVFTLSGLNADWPYIVNDYHLVICAAKPEGGIDWESGNGTGGYVLKEHEAGVRTLVTRNPNYWKEGRAHFDSVETLQIADSSARTSALRTGVIQAFTNADLKTVHLLDQAPGMRVLAVTGNKHSTVPMDVNAAPFDNNDVRMALKLAVDREQWVKTILRGYGQPGNDHPIGPANQFRATAEEIPQREYDPEKALWHLKRAGMDRVSVTLSAADTAFEGAIDAAILYKESAARAHIDIDVVREAEDGYWSDVWLVKPWSFSYYGGRVTEDWMFSQVYHSGASWNETKWHNERFDKLLFEGRATLDPVKRRAIYVEMQRILRDEGGQVVPIFMDYVHGLSDKVMTGEHIGNNWELDGHKCAERWWFA